jgi:hypothetical protein
MFKPIYVPLSYSIDSLTTTMTCQKMRCRAANLKLECLVIVHFTAFCLRSVAFSLRPVTSKNAEIESAHEIVVNPERLA